MIKTRKDLRTFIRYEGHLYGEKKALLFGPVISEKKIAWKYICLLRYEEYYTNVGHRILSLFFRFKKVKLGRKYGLHFPINVIEQGLLLTHPYNIMVNAKHIGKNCQLHFGVALVKGGNDDCVPVIGNDVVIGTGSVVVGGVTIADGIAIGANSTVTKSFLEPNICIAGCPAKKISSNGSSSWHLKRPAN